MMCISSKINDYGVPHFHKSSRCSQLQQARYHSTSLCESIQLVYISITCLDSKKWSCTLYDWNQR